MDKIYIRDLEFIGYHGVFEEEKKLGQKFFVSLELTTNLREAGLNDDITKTTHYGEVSESVKKIFFQKKYDLIETLAEDIAREVLLSFPLIKEVKFVDYLSFMIFFPTLASGPIDRSRRFMEDIHHIIPREEYVELLGTGLFRLLLGLVYKVVLSGLLYLAMNHIPNRGLLFTTVSYMYLYTFYLFFDFAGYSLMAVGVSKVFGIETPMNFNKPFLAKDMKDFWNRWHISLSHWFRDFIFSRLVFAMFKRKTFKSSLTTAMVAYVINMSVMGIWHGLNLSYFLYGLYHGIILALTELFQKTKFYKANKNKKWFEYSSIFVTFNLVMFGFFIFSEKFVHILRILGGRLW